MLLCWQLRVLTREAMKAEDKGYLLSLLIFCRCNYGRKEKENEREEGWRDETETETETESSH